MKRVYPPSTRNIGLLGVTVLCLSLKHWLALGFISLEDLKLVEISFPTRHNKDRLIGKTLQSVFTVTLLYTLGKKMMMSGKNMRNGVKDAGKMCFL